MGRALGALFPRGAPLVRGTLQVVLVVHLQSAWQHVVHHHDADGEAAALDAVEAVELW